MGPGRGLIALVDCPLKKELFCGLPSLLVCSVERREVPRDPVHEAEQPGRTAGRRLPGTYIQCHAIRWEQFQEAITSELMISS